MNKLPGGEPYFINGRVMANLFTHINLGLLIFLYLPVSYEVSGRGRIGYSAMFEDFIGGFTLFVLALAVILLLIGIPSMKYWKKSEVFLVFFNIGAFFLSCVAIAPMARF